MDNSTWVIIPPKIKSMMTAVIRAQFPMVKGDTEDAIQPSMRPVTLHYEDGTTETATINVPEDNWFAIVGNVQAQRT